MTIKSRSLNHILEYRYAQLCDRSRDAYLKAGPHSFDQFQGYRRRLRKAYEARVDALKKFRDR